MFTESSVAFFLSIYFRLNDYDLKDRKNILIDLNEFYLLFIIICLLTCTCE